MNHQIVSRKDAASDGLRHYFTGKPCKNGHVAPRFVVSANCSECMAERNRTPEVKAYMKAFWQSEQGEVSRKVAARPEVRIPRQKAYRESGKAIEWESRHRKTGRKSQTVSEWRKKNRHKTAEWYARYQAAKVNATPSWLTAEHKAEMHKVYMQAKLSGKTVDHIVPIRGRNVCGLHVPWNLQLLTAEENSRKNNNFED